MKRMTMMVVALLAAGVVMARAEGDDVVAAGKELAVKKCKMCHAIDGAGGKKKALAEAVKGHTDEQITKILAGDQVTSEGKPHALKPKFSDDEMKSLLAYLKSLGASQ